MLYLLYRLPDVIARHWKTILILAVICIAVSPLCGLTYPLFEAIVRWLEG